MVVPENICEENILTSRALSVRMVSNVYSRWFNLKQVSIIKKITNIVWHVHVKHDAR